MGHARQWQERPLLIPALGNMIAHSKVLRTANKLLNHCSGICSFTVGGIRNCSSPLATFQYDLDAAVEQRKLFRQRPATQIASLDPRKSASMGAVYVCPLQWLFSACSTFSSIRLLPRRYLDFKKCRQVVLATCANLKM